MSTLFLAFLRFLTMKLSVPIVIWKHDLHSYFVTTSFNKTVHFLLSLQHQRELWTIKFHVVCFVVHKVINEIPPFTETIQLNFWSEQASVDSGITDVTDFVTRYLDSGMSQIYRNNICSCWCNTNIWRKQLLF